MGATEPIELRGHHLANLAYAMFGWYPEKPQSETGHKAKEFLEGVLNDDRQKVKLIAYEPDKICDICDRFMKEVCYEPPGAFGPGFAMAFTQSTGDDYFVAQKLGVGIGRTYLVKTLVKKIKKEEKMIEKWYKEQQQRKNQ